ncbi:hypothetical protein BX600DRAFT_526047 [Xylariales sp. PMI_506]|nr:hypothetical protein BX600DRAFT_526047 [Xylariales sp. PMI_506]
MSSEFPRSNTITDRVVAALEPSIRLLSFSSQTVSFEPDIRAPFDAIRRLFDHLQTNPEIASSLNATYPRRGIFKTAATHNASSDQKFTIDLSPARNGQIADELQGTLAAAGLREILEFFAKVNNTYVQPILLGLSDLAVADLQQAHQSGNVNYRLCDYNTSTADPESDNGCGAHTDYDAAQPGVWTPEPGDATVILAGWCAVILSGGCIQATRHRVRRTPGVRRLGAILFVAPDPDVTLKPLDGAKIVRPFPERAMAGEISVRWFKEAMGKKWRWREGNQELDGGENTITQDGDIDKLIWCQEYQW